jgi:hypothetical protein
MAPDSKFFLIQHEQLPNGTLQMAHVLPDVSGWEEGFFLVKGLYLYHDNEYLVVPAEHPKFNHFIDKITLVNTKSRIKLRASGEELEMLVPKYANNKELCHIFAPFASWDVKPWDIYIVDFGEKKSILQLTPLQRSNGIPDDLEVILEQSEVLMSHLGFT